MIEKSRAIENSDNLPIAALSTWQFKELLKEWGVIPSESIQVKAEDFPDIFGKDICCKITGYAMDTINKKVCKKEIPYYKIGGRVLFRRDEIRQWMLSNRVCTINEFVESKEAELAERRNKR